MLNCLGLQRVLRGIKRSQSSPAAQPFQLLTAFFLVIHQALDLNSFDHHAFWAACMLGYFGFLRAAEFTAPNLTSFSPFIIIGRHCSGFAPVTSLPLCSDKSVKNGSIPSRLPHPYWSGKGTPLCSSCFVGLPLLARKINVPGPLFLLANGQPLSHSILTDWLRQIFSTVGIEGNFSSHSFPIGAATVAAPDAYS